jgi:The ARF-like 2 binding protein BART
MPEFDDVIQALLEVISSEEFNERITAFYEAHADKFNEGSGGQEEFSHEQYSIFEEYKREIEGVIDSQMKHLLDLDSGFDSAAFLAEHEDELADFESNPVLCEIIDTLTSLNDFESFKNEVMVYMNSTDKQDLALFGKDAKDMLQSEQVHEISVFSPQDGEDDNVDETDQEADEDEEEDEGDKGEDAVNFKRWSARNFVTGKSAIFKSLKIDNLENI